MTDRWEVLPLSTQSGQVGRVVKFCPGANFGAMELGDRVGIKWINGICGSCRPCLGGRDGLCFCQRISGYYTPGSFRQSLTPIPKDLPSDLAAPMLCAGVAAYSALKKSGAKSGDWIVLLGAGGGLGHIACQIASRGMGMRVIGVDSASKRDLVLDSGAEIFIDHLQGNEDEAVNAATDGLGAQAVLVLTAVNSAYACGTSMLIFGGSLVCVGMPDGVLKPIETAYPQHMISGALAIIGVIVGDRRDAIEVIRLVERGIIKTHLLKAKMEDLTEVFQRMQAGLLTGKMVLELSLDS